MSNPVKTANRLPPLSVRVNEDERRALEARAGDLPLSTYVKRVLFADDAPSYRKSAKVISADRTLAARLLAALGASRIASNLNQLAKQANLGSLYFDEATKADLNEACAHVADIRKLLMQALGKQEAKADIHELLGRIFNDVAAPKKDRS